MTPQQLYTSLLGGATVARAIRSTPGDPTWLAYTLYGNPSATFAQEAHHV